MNIFYGVLLSVLTAVGCIAYEKLVKRYSFSVILIEKALFALLALLVLPYIVKSSTRSEVDRLCRTPEDVGWFLLFFVTEFTTVLWFVLTKRMNVAWAGVFETTYIALLVAIYIAFKIETVSVNFVIGCSLIVAGAAIIHAR